MRRAFQWAVALVVLLVPFARIGGESLLRLDPATLSVHVGGATLEVEEFYLFLPLALALVVFFLLATLVLGRVWCGWACPQTALVDLAEWCAQRLGVTIAGGRMKATGWQRAGLHLVYLGIALLVAANLVWYFVSPYVFFPRLLKGTLDSWVLATLAVAGGTVYCDLAWIRRLLCRDFCPYGRFQAILTDPGTLTLRFDPGEAHRCIECGGCVRVCPVGIDIRRGYQIACIDCGRCLDACREVMARRGQAGIIRYSFGLRGRGPAALLNMRTALLSLLLCALAATFFAAAGGRSGATLMLERVSAGSVLPDGARTTFITAVVANRAGQNRILTLSAALEGGSRLELRGPISGLLLEGGERRRVAFAVLAPSSPAWRPLTAIFTLRDERGQVVARQRGLLPATKE